MVALVFVVKNLLPKGYSDGLAVTAEFTFDPGGIITVFWKETINWILDPGFCTVGRIDYFCKTGLVLEMQL